MTNIISNGLYNEELKRRFFKEKESQVASTRHICIQFEKCAQTEMELQKDISNWTLYEITDYYKILGTPYFEALRIANSIFSQYCQFCLENNLVKDNQNHFFECTDEVLLNCVSKIKLNKSLISREQLIAMVDALPNPKDQFILMSFFEFGKSKDYKDIVYAKFSDLDRENKTLQLQNRKVKISSKLISIIDDCEKTNKYYSISGSESRECTLIDYGYIVKSYPNQSPNASDIQKGRNIYRACERVFMFLGVIDELSINSITNSGKLHFIETLAKKYSMSKMEILYSEHLKEVEEQFGCEIYRGVFSKKYREYL